MKRMSFRLTFCCVSLLTLAAASARSATLDEAMSMYRGGDYARCIAACDQTLSEMLGEEEWWLLKIEAQLAIGQNADALATFETALDRHDRSIRLRLLGREVLQVNGRAREVEGLLEEIRLLAGRSPWRYGSAEDRVALGEALLLSGADARQVLELFYDRVKKEQPESPDAFIASGRLSLDKHDYALAAESFQEAAKRLPDDPDIHLGLARAYASDSDRATAALKRALELNPRHVDSLLFQADNLIDREDYETAQDLLVEALAVNPVHPSAWAYRAVLAHLSGEREQESAHRERALAAWGTNPQVDHLIGQKLSAKYRFAEGAAYQRRALQFDAQFRPAKIQLAQDLLRLGGEDEGDGWRLAAEVAKQDPYDVVAYNLVTLHDAIQKFALLKNDHFRLRMDPREAQIYGDRAMRLLTRARETLCAKYGLELKRPVVVEMFPQQKDFAIRTFGLPGGAGFLGVCFGNVITANSPASRGGNPVNWEAVLWHEFAHVVTLQLTSNKMPRWLSEGISVYEERQHNRAWGQSMNPTYRKLILDEDGNAVTPVSKLSGAFLRPPTPMHLQFAYYESSMVVEYVIERWGTSAITAILRDLGNDVPINEALAKHTEPIDALDENFSRWLKQQAEALGGRDVDWALPELSLDADSAAMAEWNREHPNSFFGLLGEGRALIAERRFQQALTPLEKAALLYPDYGEPGGPYILQAQAYRELGAAKQERQMLEKHLALSAEAIDGRLRLIELATAAQDWPTVRSQAEQVLAINPLIPAPHRALADAAQATEERAIAIEAVRTLLLLDPLDLAAHHHRLAILLAEEQRLPEARRHVLMALEEAPRFRDAHRLLLNLVARMPTERAATSTTAPASQPLSAD